MKKKMTMPKLGGGAKPHIRARKIKPVPPSAFPQAPMAFPQGPMPPSPDQAVAAPGGGPGMAAPMGAAPGDMGG